MSVNREALSLSRRGFLKAMGIAASAASLPLSRVSASPAPIVQARIGLLLPSSAAYDSLDAGFRLGLQQNGTHSLELITERTEHPSAAFQKARTLISQEAVDLIVGGFTPNLAAQLRPLLETRGTFFVVAEAGANVTRVSELSPSVYYHSLDLWRASWAIGQWGARNLGRKAFVATSFYESGYDSLEAFRIGYQAAGGEVTATSVTHVPPHPVDWTAVMDGIRQARPDFVYALYSDRDAVEFVRAYADSGLAGQIPLAGSPFLVDEPLLAEQGQGEAAAGILSCLGWAPGLPSEENQAFMAAYRGMHGRNPDAFAVLGYETAQLVLGALAEAGTTAVGELASALDTARQPSPRGRLRMDPAVHSTSSPLYIREVRAGAAGLENVIIASINPVDERDDRLAGLRNAQRSGWTNAYLSV